MQLKKRRREEVPVKVMYRGGDRLFNEKLYEAGSRDTIV